MLTRNETPFDSRRAEYCLINTDSTKAAGDAEVNLLNVLDSLYRSLCAIMYNFAPLSGHPGGSISSGRIVASLLYNGMSYDIIDPNRKDQDILSYAAGHKALGLYAHWALRNEIMRIAFPDILPKEKALQLTLEDLLGFRRNPSAETFLFKKFASKALDGHPTPATPFVKLATGASGVGLASSIGYALAAADSFESNPPIIHILEGEGGLTPGRVSEALAAAATASLKNIVLHIDWNQSSIDSDAVCRADGKAGDYVQWNPAELTYFHDWNTILVEDGMDFQQIIAAQQKAGRFNNHQPTAIIYKTIKGWKYGIEGSKSHGAGHSLCSPAFYCSISELLKLSGKELKLCTERQFCNGGKDPVWVEQCYWDALQIIRHYLENNKQVTCGLADMILFARQRLNLHNRTIKCNLPDVNKIYHQPVERIPEQIALAHDSNTTLRGQLGKVLHYYNELSNGAVLTAAADLLGSTSVDLIGKGFREGFYNADSNPDSRTLSVGGICEDATAAVMSGISSYGNHIGVCSSYGAFNVALGHIAARLHAIGNQSKQAISKEPYNPFIIVAAHTGVKTGEDGPTHADPQPLQLIQENFPNGCSITLTPWEPQEIWPLITSALHKRPAVITPFVTRPMEKVINRQAEGLAPAIASANGVYLLRRSRKQIPDAIIVLQGSEVAYAFVTETLRLLAEDDIDVSAYYVASAELFDALPPAEQEVIFPEHVAQRAMGITGFTLPTMYRWIRSSLGRQHSLYPFKQGHYLGSGKAHTVITEAGLGGKDQYNAIVDYLSALEIRTVYESELTNQ